MNLTLNKLFKTALCVLLVACVCLTFAGCLGNKDITDADSITVSGSYVESWMYDVPDEALVKEMVDVFSTLEYEETDETIDMMIGNGVLILTFNKGDKALSKYMVDCNNVMSFNGKKCYKITSDFDFYAVRDTLKGVYSVDDNSTATADQN